MSVVFLDTNALLKLHLAERGSAWLQGYVVNQQVSMSELVLFESATVLRKYYAQGNLTQTQALAILKQIIRDSAVYDVIQLGGEPQLTRLSNLVFNLPNNLQIRSLDSIHLVAAQISQEAANKANPPEEFVFVSSDRQLLRAAQAEGFALENPEDHP